MGNVFNIKVEVLCVFVGGCGCLYVFVFVLNTHFSEALFKHLANKIFTNTFRPCLFVCVCLGVNGVPGWAGAWLFSVHTYTI